jgi:hypothetical protein
MPSKIVAKEYQKKTEMATRIYQQQSRQQSTFMFVQEMDAGHSYSSFRMETLYALD